MADNIFETLLLFTGKVQGGGFQQLNKHIKTSYNGLFSLRNMFGAFFGYDLYSTIRNSIPALIDVSKKFGAMESRFQAITNSSKLAGDELNWVKGQADRLGLSFLETADNYSIFYASIAKTMGGGAARQIFTNWAEAFRVLHIDPAKQERVLYALREMSSKGKIYLQDLSNQLGSHIPAAMNIAAKSMGYVGKDAVGRFRKDITAGKVDVQKFLIVFSEAMNGAYVSSEKLASAMEKPDAQIGRMVGRWQNFMIAMSKSGFEKDLVKTLKIINNLLPKLEKNAHAIYVTIKAIGVILLSIGLVKGGFALIRMFQDAKLAFKIIGMAKGLKQMAEAIKLIQIAGAAGEIGASGSLMGIIIGALTNPWILGIVLVTGLTIALGFIIKKFFPNVWNNILGWWLDFKHDVISFMGVLMETPFMKALTSFFGTEKKGFGKNVQDKQNAWAQRYPNHEFIFNVGGALDAANMWAYNKVMNLTPLTRGINFARQAAPALTKYIIEQKYKIDVKVDGVEDKKTIMDSVHSAIEAFAEKSKKQSVLGIINSRNNNKLPFTPLGSSVY